MQALADDVVILAAGRLIRQGAVAEVLASMAGDGRILVGTPEPEKLELTLARIARIVGPHKVGSLQPLDTHRSEAFQLHRFAPAPIAPIKEQTPRRLESVRNNKKRREEIGLKPSSDRKPQSQNGAETAVTALRIFRPPVRATVTLHEGRPVRVACPKRKDICGEILWAAGPWRSSGDWWEQEGWARDEWDIALQEITGIILYRLVRDLFNGRWLLEGSYD